MEDKAQYNQPSTGNISVPSPKHVTTRTPNDIKISQLEEQIGEQGRELLKLRREIGRLKNDITDLTNTLRNRG